MRRELRRAPVRMGIGSRALFGLMLAIVHLVSLIPDVLLLRLGAACGWLAYRLDRRHVRIGMRNLQIAFPDKTVPERAAILRASYINLGRGAAEYIRLGGFFYRRLKDRVSYDRIEYWDEMSDRYGERGALILTAHFGNFELMAAAQALHGYQAGLVHHTQRFLAGDALMTWIRERAGVEVIRKHAAARAVIKSLREGEMIGIPFDQNAKRSEAVFVPFFGELAATTTGLARLAQLADAIVVPCFIVRQPDKCSHKIVIKDVIELRETGDKQADLEENTRRFVAAIEEMVLRYPEQFLWTHRRYRTRPRGLPPIYD